MDEVREKFDKFRWLGMWIRAGLEPTTIAVLTAIFDHMNTEGAAWPKIGTLCEMVGRGRSTVRRHIKTAEEEGFIFVENRGHRSNMYHARFGKNDLRPTEQSPTSERIQPPTDGRIHPPTDEKQPPTDERMETTTAHQSADTSAHESADTSAHQWAPEYIKEPVKDSAAAAGADAREDQPQTENLDQWILEQLDNHGITANLQHPQQILTRLAAGKLERGQWQQYLLDDIADKAERVESGDLRPKQALKYLGSTSDVQKWTERTRPSRSSADAPPPKSFDGDIVALENALFLEGLA